MNAWIALALLAAAAPAAADELRDLCPDRPGLGTPACIVDPGHLLIEAGLAGWQREHDDTTVTHGFTAGDLLVRYGVTRGLEAFAGWDGYERDRIRDRTTGAIGHVHGGGDLSFGIKQALTDPDGKGAAVSVQLFATAPTGSNGFGSDGWTEGMIVPIEFDLPAGFSLALSPELDRLPDTLRGGHHAAYAGVAGLGHDLGPVAASVEISASRDDDPGARTTQVIADLNLALGIGKSTQLDAEVDAGLDRAAPDVRVAFGVARRF